MREHETRPGQEGSPDQTRKLALPLTSDPVQRNQKISLPAETAGQTQAPAPARGTPRSWGWKVGVGLGGLVVLGAVILLLSSRGPELQVANPRPPKAEGEAPDAVRAYLDQARGGDVHAMRMLGVMYYYGLNVPQDRERGLHWYRQAAEKGSDAAREDLAKLEQTGTGK